jgi:hypothetical protein
MTDFAPPTPPPTRLLFKLHVRVYNVSRHWWRLKTIKFIHFFVSVMSILRQSPWITDKVARTPALLLFKQSAFRFAILCGTILNRFCVNATLGDLEKRTAVLQNIHIFWDVRACRLCNEITPARKIVMTSSLKTRRSNVGKYSPAGMA